jgi:hypothetical protein
MSHTDSKIVSRNIQFKETDARNSANLADYSIPSSSRTSQSETARMMSDGVHASMVPNTIACIVVMDRSPNSNHELTTQRLDFDQRMTRPRLLCDVEQPLAQQLFGLLLCCDAETIRYTGM